MSADAQTNLAKGCATCARMPLSYRTEVGHLALDKQTGATVLVPHDAPTIHLQGIGRVPAKRAADLRPGDRTVWNYGYVYEVVDVAAVGRSSLTVTSRDARTGKTFTRRHTPDRLVAVAE